MHIDMHAGRDEPIVLHVPDLVQPSARILGPKARSACLAGRCARARACRERLARDPQAGVPTVDVSGRRVGTVRDAQERRRVEDDVGRLGRAGRRGAPGAFERERRGGQDRAASARSAQRVVRVQENATDVPMRNATQPPWRMPTRFSMSTHAREHRFWGSKSARRTLLDDTLEHDARALRPGNVHGREREARADRAREARVARAARVRERGAHGGLGAGGRASCGLVEVGHDGGEGADHGCDAVMTGRASEMEMRVR
jgi:hypothetical protein